MKKIAATLICAVLLTCFATTSSQADGDRTTGATLQTKAETVRDTLLKSDSQALYDSLAPWIQGQLKLDCVAVRKEARYLRDNAREGDISRINGLLSLYHGANESDDLLNEFCDVSPALYLKLALGLVHNFDLPAEPEEWLTTERIIATEDISNPHWMLGENSRRRVGVVQFSHPDSWRRITVRCVDETDSWQVVDLSLGFGPDLSDVLTKSGVKNVRLDIASPEWRRVEKCRAEGEQLLGSGRDYSRVEYSKDGIAKKAFTEFMSEEDFESSFSGFYFKLRATLYKKPDMERGAIVAEPVNDDSIGYGAIYFNYESGESTVKWYDTEEDLEEALKAFETAK